MKEAPSAIDMAENVVIETEDRWVNFRISIADELKKRAEGSNTNRAWLEYYSALEIVEKELERLTPDERDTAE